MGPGCVGKYVWYFDILYSSPDEYSIKSWLEIVICTTFWMDWGFFYMFIIIISCQVVWTFEKYELVHCIKVVWTTQVNINNLCLLVIFFFSFVKIIYYCSFYTLKQMEKNVDVLFCCVIRVFIFFWYCLFTKYKTIYCINMISLYLFCASLHGSRIGSRRAQFYWKIQTYSMHKLNYRKWIGLGRLLPGKQTDVPDIPCPCWVKKFWIRKFMFPIDDQGLR